MLLYNFYPPQFCVFHRHYFKEEYEILIPFEKSIAEISLW